MARATLDLQEMTDPFDRAILDVRERGAKERVDLDPHKLGLGTQHGQDWPADSGGKQPRTVKRTAAGLRYRRSGQLTSTGVLRRKGHPVVTLTNGDIRTAATILRGTRYPHEYRCSACGYGIAVRELPVACPMCGGAAWELVEAKAVLAPEDLRGAERRTSSAAECPARLRRSEGSAAGPGRM